MILSLCLMENNKNTQQLVNHQSSQHLDKFCERFKPQLELLDREQKLALRVILSYFIWGKEEWSDYRVNDAWSDSLQGLFIEGRQFNECLSSLEGISVKEAESLLSDLQIQCNGGQLNA